MNNYSIIMLGLSGSEKTVFLSSLYKKLSTQSELGFFLQIDTAEKRKRLNHIYTQVVADDKWQSKTVECKKNKTQISERLGHDKPVMSISHSPNGKLLASGSKDYTVRIWQLR